MSQMPPPSMPPAPPPMPDNTMNYGTPPPKTNGMALTAMIMGIAAIPLACVGIGVPLGITALILGIIALNKINRKPLQNSGKGFAITGIVTGGIGGVLAVPLLIAIMLPSLGKARELSNRTVCIANLRGISMSMAVYGADNRDDYPATKSPAAAGSYGDLFTTATTRSTMGVEAALTAANFSPRATNAGSVTAGMFMLVARGDVSSKSFLCKSDPAGGLAAPAVSGASDYYTNFSPDAKSYSYSFAYPWSTSGGNPPGGWWRATINAEIAIAADMAPLAGTGSPAATPAGTGAGANLKLANSINHQRDGQNVAFGDGHADFVRRPDVGQRGDNIWTTFGSGTNYSTGTAQVAPGEVTGFVGGVAGNYDIVMVPKADLSTNERR